MNYVITSVIDGHDNLRPPTQTEAGTRFICFTNNPMQPECGAWEFRPVYEITDLSTSSSFQAARTARVPKILPHLMLPDDCEHSIWHDANFELSMKPSEVIGRLLRFDDWAAHKHPARDCIYREAEILLKEGIGTRELIENEIRRYSSFHPDSRGVYGAGAGLWANGMLVRRHTPAVTKLNELWWTLYSRGCERDQLSFPVAMRACEMNVNTIQDDIFRSPYMKFHWHAAWKDKEDNVVFRPQRERMAARLAKLQEIAGGAMPWKAY